MEFKAGGTEGAVYNVFDDSTYSVLVEDSVAETGNVSVNGDTLFLLKNVKYNITHNPEVLFLVEDDSICRLELKEQPGPHRVRVLASDFEVQDIYEYFKKDCEVLKVSR